MAVAQTAAVETAAVETALASVAPELPERLALIRRLLVERYGETPSARRAACFLARLERRIARPPRVLILGEANSGKSTLANLLLGFDLLATDLVRNTRLPVRIAHAHAPAVRRISREGEVERIGPGRAPERRDDTRLIEVMLPIERLTRFEPIDTPGLEADPGVIGEARLLAQGAHMAVWCTVAAQAWRASEAALWSAVGQRLRRQSILAVTHAGALSPIDRDKVLGRLQRDAGGQFHSIVLVAEDGRGLGRAGGDEAALDTGAEPSIAEPAIAAAVRAMAAEVQRARLGRVAQTVHRFADHLDAIATAPVPTAIAGRPLDPVPPAVDAAAAAG